MERYRNLGGKSGVVQYAIGDGSITVVFEKGGPYLYDASAPGSEHVAQMQQLAREGAGLNTYISKYVRKNYAAKL